MESAFRGARPLPLAGAVMLNAPLLGLVTLRSALALGRLGYALRRDVLFATVTLGFVAGSYTPGGAGELLRAGALQARGGVALRDGLALVTFERGLSFYLLGLTAAASAAPLLLPYALAGPVAALALGLALLPVAAGPLLARLPPPQGTPHGFLALGLHQMRLLGGRLAHLLADRRLVLAWSALTLAAFGVIAAQFWLLSRGVSGDASGLEALAAFCISSAAGVVTLLPLGLGGADASLAAVLHRTGLVWEKALAVTALMRLAITLPLVIAAAASYVYLSALRRAGAPQP